MILEKSELPTEQDCKTRAGLSSTFDESKNQLQKSQSVDQQNHSFFVAVRIKPKQNAEQSVKIIVNKNSKQLSIESGKNSKLMITSSKCKTFKVDKIFDQKSQNEHIFDTLVKNKLYLLKKNVNLSLMAYGPTNSGKTFSIFGCKQNRNGLAFLVGNYLLNTLFVNKFKFYLSYLQIYNENIQDLLANSSKRVNLNIFEDVLGKINIPNLTKHEVENYDHLCQLIEIGNIARSQCSNNVNQMSSRSHAVIQLQIFSIEESQDGIIQLPIEANFMMIDLAGSEKSSPYFTQSNQLILKEGSNINKSLLALGNCIKSLQNGDNHIPYRDSKLTRILKQNLKGNCHNLLIACVSQNENQLDESISTLQYASKACRIEKCIKSFDSKNRDKYINVNCEHCKMGINLEYIRKILKIHSFSITDELIKKQDRNYSKSTLTSISPLESQPNYDNSLVQSCILKLKRLKKVNHLNRELILIQNLIDQMNHHEDKYNPSVLQLNIKSESRPKGDRMRKQKVSKPRLQKENLSERASSFSLKSVKSFKPSKIKIQNQGIQRLPLGLKLNQSKQPLQKNKQLRQANKNHNFFRQISEICLLEPSSEYEPQDMLFPNSNNCEDHQNLNNQNNQNAINKQIKRMKPDKTTNQFILSKNDERQQKIESENLQQKQKKTGKIIIKLTNRRSIGSLQKIR